MSAQRGSSMLATVGLVALGIVILVVVLKIAAAIATALFIPLLFIGIGVAIGAFVVSSRGRRSH